MFYKATIATLVFWEPLLAQDFTYNEPTLNKENPKPFGLKLEYGQIHSAGKSSYLSRNGKAGAKYENGRDEVRLDADGSYLKSGPDIVDDRRHAFFGYDRYIGSRLWLFLLADWVSNKVVGLNYTQLTGAGVKLDLLRNETYVLDIGVAYLKRAKQTEFIDETTAEKQVTTKDDKVLSARLKMSYETDLARFSLISFYQPVIGRSEDPVSGEDREDYNWSLESSIAYNLTKRVYLKYGYVYRYESIRTGPGAPRVDEKTTLQLGYEL